MEASKRGNRIKIKKRVQEGAYISAKDSKGNNAPHLIVSQKEKRIALFEGKQKVACLKLILKLNQGKAQFEESINAKNQEG